MNKKIKTALIRVGVFVLVAGAVYALLSIYFGWAVANDAPGPYDDMSAEENGSEDAVSAGSDWRTWRSYTDDFVISDDVTVCLSPFDTATGYAVYNSDNGDRIGSLSGIETDGSETIVCEDTDGDGVNELGITISDETVYFKYTGEPWIEGQGGGCFERI